MDNQTLQQKLTAAIRGLLCFSLVAKVSILIAVLYFWVPESKEYVDSLKQMLQADSPTKTFELPLVLNATIACSDFVVIHTAACLTLVLFFELAHCWFVFSCKNLPLIVFVNIIAVALIDISLVFALWGIKQSAEIMIVYLVLKASM